MLSGNPYLDKAEQIKQILLALQLRYAEGAGQQPQMPKPDYGRMITEAGKGYLKDQAIKQGLEAGGAAVGIGGASAGAGALPSLAGVSAGATPGLMLPSLAPAVPGVGTAAASGGAAAGAGAGAMSVLGPAIVALPALYGAWKTSGGGFSQEHKARGRLRQQLKDQGLIGADGKLQFSDGSAFDVGLEGSTNLSEGELANFQKGGQSAFDPRTGKAKYKKEWFGVDFSNPLSRAALESGNLAAAKLAGQDEATRRSMAGYFTNALIQGSPDQNTLAKRSGELLSKFGVSEAEKGSLANLISAQDSQLIEKEKADGAKGRWSSPAMEDLYQGIKQVGPMNIKQMKYQKRMGTYNPSSREWGASESPQNLTGKLSEIASRLGVGSIGPSRTQGSLSTRDAMFRPAPGTRMEDLGGIFSQIGSRLGIDPGRLQVQQGGMNMPSAGVSAVPQQPAAPMEPKRKWYPSLGKYLDNPNYKG